MLRFPDFQTCDKPELPKLPGRRPIIQIGQRPIYLPPQIYAQPKTISKVPLKEKSIFPERSVKHRDQVVQVPKFIVPKIVSEHVKKTLSLDNPIIKSKTRNEMQDIRREKPAYADSIYRPPPKTTEIPTQIIP